MTNSKNKGSSWEREIAKKLTEWLTCQKSEYYFWRSPSSGGVATISPINKDLHGDIIPLKQEAELLCSRFVIEAKTGYPDASIDKFLKNNKSDSIKEFWIQTTEQANDVGKYPMLIYKKKGMPIPWIGLDFDIFKKIDKYLSNERYIHLFWGKEDELPDLYFYDFNKFLEYITPDIIKKIKAKK